VKERECLKYQVCVGRAGTVRTLIYYTLCVPSPSFITPIALPCSPHASHRCACEAVGIRKDCGPLPDCFERVWMAQ
jgi:hypothetical protein